MITKKILILILIIWLIMGMMFYSHPKYVRSYLLSYYYQKLFKNNQDLKPELENPKKVLLPEIPFGLRAYSNKLVGKSSSYKTLIVSHYTLDNLYIKSVINNHTNYAKLHGYDYWFRNGVIDGNFLDLNMPGLITSEVAALYWQKLTSVKQAMDLKEHGKIKYRWIMWIDGDAVFTNSQQNLEDLMIKLQITDQDYLILTRELCCNQNNVCALACINSGVFLIRNNFQARTFLENAINSFEIYKEHPFPEQTAMEDQAFGLLKNIDDVTQSISSNLNLEVKCNLKIQPGIKLIPAKFMNSGYPGGSPKIIALWKKGDYIAHFAGHNNRNKVIPSFLQCIANNQNSLELCENIK